MDEHRLRLFTNKLKRRHTELRNWSRNSDVTCYRIFEKDSSGIPLSIDLYDNSLFVTEYETSSAQGPLDDAEAYISRAAGIIGVPENRIHRRYRPLKGACRGMDEDKNPEEKWILESGLKFKVNLSDYTDTGLFLDHRISRQIVGELAAGGRLLNLFCYTGGFTVYAAREGATGSVSVDLSAPYLSWAEENLRENLFSPEKHKLVNSDVRAYLKEAAERGEKFDAIVLDPPTFSNSRKMEGILDIQRDHEELIRLCLPLLTKKGWLFFSTNCRKFKLNKRGMSDLEIREITEDTIPDDFRYSRIHRSWLIRPRKLRSPSQEQRRKTYGKNQVRSGDRSGKNRFDRRGQGRPGSKRDDRKGPKSRGGVPLRNKG